MQPEIFSFSSPMSRWRSSEAKRFEMFWATMIERALASAQ